MTPRVRGTAPLQRFPVRSAVPSDRHRVARFLAEMDHDGLYQRHFTHGEAPNLALLQRLAAIDHRSRVAVLALGRDGEVIGHSEYVEENGMAEFALMVLPRHRGCGIGKRLLQALLDIASAAGLRGMHGMIQASNGGALKVALECGFQAVPGDDRAVVIVSRVLPASVRAVPERSAVARAGYPSITHTHDPDRTPLHRRLGSRAPLRAGGG
ncbi:MAG: GNAT family N-acetyltransferase [Sulfuritalea sp.]|nr:GNAT family N-acetyltransferase [Sulfuritalea sp.]